MRRPLPLAPAWLCAALLFASVGASLLRGEVAPAPSQEQSQGTAPTPDQQQMQSLTDAHQAALDSGDAIQVLESGRSLGAFALRLLGEVYLASDRTQQAADAFSQSWQIVPEPETGLLLLGCDLRAQKSVEAARVSQTLLEQGGDTARTHLLLAGAHFNADDLTGTIAELTRAVTLDPQMTSAHLTLGEAYLELNEFQYNPDSLREFTDAQRLDPTSFLSNFDLGSMLSRYQRYSEAAPFLERAAAADPASPDPWFQLGMNLYAEDRGTDAIAALDRSITLTGDDRSRNGYQLRRAYEVLSRLAADSGDTARSVQAAREADELHAEMLRADTATSLSESTGMVVNNPPRTTRPRPSGNPSGSVPNAQQQALEQQLKGVVAGSLNDAGTALARGHDYAGALPLFRAASIADPSLQPVLRNLGLAAFHTEQYGEAVTALTRALEQTPHDALAADYLQQARARRDGNRAPR